MRIATPELGAIAVAFLRCAIAGLALVPLLLLSGRLGALRGRGWQVVVAAAFNSSLPFCLIAYATASMSAGMAAILNATSPMWAGVVAHLWLKDRLTAPKFVGLVVGFAGVAFLVSARGAVTFDSFLVIGASLAAALSYGFAANYTRSRFTGVDPMALAAASQLAAALLLVPVVVFFWPQREVSQEAWFAALGLGLFCTGLAYILYFRLIAHVGPARAIAVTFLVPAFAVLWGVVFLRERVTLQLLLGATIILVGTGLVTGVLKLPRQPRAA